MRGRFARMGKRIVAVLLGIVAASVVIFALESVGHKVYAPPGGLDFKNPEAVRAFIASMPRGAFALVLLGYALGSLVGGVTATLISGRTSSRAAIAVGAVLTILGLINLVSVPHPMWFAVTSLLLYIPCAWLGSRILLSGATSRNV